ncbi:MAG: DUF5360 family protein [Myxococcales bacterium]|nr:DUF5360 family protein [Myxococcales bacterium]
MRRSLFLALLITDLGFLAYWLVSGIAELGWISLPASLMYAGYGDDRVCAWNWSFFPLDVAFSVTGLLAVRWGRAGRPAWRPMALVSLTLTVVAGLMAVSYWTLTEEIVASWYLTNLLLVLWPLPYLVWLMRALGEGGRPPATA